jgi:uncharacterized membrane protein YeaQ/YmgE (transglycosylase-associated protein family)
MINLLLWILFGAIIGWLASVITGSRGGLGWDVIIGIFGAVLGGFIMDALGQQGITGFNLYSSLVALLGAIVLIGIARLFTPRVPTERH